MKSAIVIGYSSMLGRRLVKKLLEHGAQVTTAGRRPESDICIDLYTGTFKQTKNIGKIDIIYHCAAAFENDSTEGTRVNHLVNAYGCHLVLSLADFAQCDHIIYVGSTFSYPKSDSKGYSSYGFTKALGEQVLEWGMKKTNGTFCSLRFSQLYDNKGLCCKHQPWFGRIVAYASRGSDLQLPRSDALRNFIHIDDASSLLVYAGEKRLVNVFSVIHPQSLTFYQMAQIAYSVFNKGGQVLPDSSKVPFRDLNFTPLDKLLAKFDFLSMKQGFINIRDNGFAEKFGPMDIC